MSSCGNNKQEEHNPQKPNVLFISIDDLRPELGCYGKDYIHSPNIDQLAKESTVFTKHFVQIPTCGASRYAMLTGMLPTTRKHLGNNAAVQFISNDTTRQLPETFIHHLKNNGYHTVGIGKISHSADGYVYGYEEPVSEQRELPESWSDLAFDAGKWGTGWNAFFAYSNGENRQSMKRQVKPYENGDVADDGYPDGLTANLALKKLKEVAGQDQPFFMGVGFFKPHLPFNAPQKYWDLYDESSLPLAPFDTIPTNVNKASLNNSGEFNSYQLGEEKASFEKKVSDDYARKLRHGYFASISYVDAQIGKLMAELKRLELYDNTIVVLWGDHGWNLGDYASWGKHTIFERSLNSAFIIKAPGESKAKSVEKIVSTVDFYPTLVELCGLKMPHETDGESLVSLLDGSGESWKDRSYGYYRNGITLRTDRYRLTKYFREASPQIELYDHEVDPNETNNIAEENPDLVAQLMPVLEQGNTGLYK
ncbi:iduronate-2-sulfatase [Portibacter lacus]|uniref:Iduronate-2-sulfatase n=1 Tax=Portibacter lacus TaxID=1099794 RepID=A0AA37SNH8_9BACT|nr:iduronate-2-sulfatase [Portibacter lacus]